MSVISTRIHALFVANNHLSLHDRITNIFLWNVDLLDWEADSYLQPDRLFRNHFGAGGDYTLSAFCFRCSVPFIVHVDLDLTILQDTVVYTNDSERGMEITNVKRVPEFEFTTMPEVCSCERAFVS